ncbi:Sbal_3080 family lipoprotein [Stutzerimonas kunmingensis]|uniref:Sbal_3080 family lipoprotein n=1 Tax=Stutzerimonas kunmingensis TaxID=1211807 RepID=UPI0028B033CE|nr:Sbal_3080 family lipoprotein [Stutzerimonas kunmingensis]
MRAALLPVLFAMLFMTGCSIKQTVTPANLSAELAPEICTIPAVGLRAGFNTTYQQLLRDKGFKTRQLAAGSSPARCPLSTTYTGTWRWDLLLYMSYADIRVYENGRQVGQAEYDARWGSGRPDKFISAEDKIAELTHQLFPSGAQSLGVVAQKTVDAPLSKDAYLQHQLKQLMSENLPYDQYQQRYRALMQE